ncbi:MAG: rane protein [Bacillales bacterium]|jgi:uncharacterized membrane protein YczE|nr:rane protein [Bacillales bacterium]
MEFFRKNTNMRLIKRILFFISGMGFISLGIALTYKAQKLGTGAFDALNMGLSDTFGLTPGTWVIISGIIILIMNTFLDKQFPKILSAIPVLIIGQFMNFWMILLGDFNPKNYPLLIAILLLGLVTIAFGAAMYILPAFSPSPIDLITLTIMNKLKWTFGKTKTVVELTALVLALFFGGPIWVGTIVITFLIGPIIQFFLKLLGKPYNRLVK